MDTHELELAVQHAAESLVQEARAAKLTCGCAESCTGGLVSAAITAVPGASEVLRGGVVSYAIPVKHDVLGVDQVVLDDPALGAVSDVCACQMCAGAARLLSCDVAVSVTGIAGPTGAEPGKPVGTVWFGVWARGGARAVCHHFSGNREQVRLQAVACALRLMREAIVEISSPTSRR